MVFEWVITPDDNGLPPRKHLGRTWRTPGGSFRLCRKKPLLCQLKTWWSGASRRCHALKVPLPGARSSPNWPKSHRPAKGGPPLQIASVALSAQWNEWSDQVCNVAEHGTACSLRRHTMEPLTSQVPARPQRLPEDPWNFSPKVSSSPLSIRSNPGTSDHVRGRAARLILGNRRLLRSS